MSMWYSVEGEMKVRACGDCESIVHEELAALEATYEDNGDGTATVMLSGGDSMSNSQPAVLEDALIRLGEFVIEPVIVVTDGNGEKYELYIGAPELEVATKSAYALDGIQQQIQNLSVSDRCKLKLLLESDVSLPNG